MIEQPVFQSLYVDYEIAAKDHDERNWKYLHWLNTPGPIFAGGTDNCGTGQPIAMNHVIGDYNYYEAVFRQPKTMQDLDIISLAASCDPFDGYSFTGVSYWKKELVELWWSYTEDIEKHVKAMLKKENSYGLGDPHLSTWNLGGEVRQLHLYGPSAAIPESYQNWLTYYHSGQLKSDVQHFVYFINNGILPSSQATLPEFKHIRQQKLDPTMVAQAKLFA